MLCWWCLKLACMLCRLESSDVFCIFWHGSLQVLEIELWDQLIFWGSKTGVEADTPFLILNIWFCFCQNVRRPKTILFELIRLKPSMLLNAKTFGQEVNSQWGEDMLSSLNDVLNSLSFNFFEKLFFCFCLPRSFTCEHFIEYNTNRPKVSLVRILILLKWFRSHIQRWANIILTWF